MDAGTMLEFIGRIRQKQVEDAINLINKYKDIDLSNMTDSDKSKLIIDVMASGNFLETMNGVIVEAALKL